MGWAQVQVVQGQEEGIMVVMFHLILLQEDECVELPICITHHMNTLTDCSYALLCICTHIHKYTHYIILSCYTVMHSVSHNTYYNHYHSCNLLA